MNRIRWQDVSLLVVGFYVFVSPWLITYFSPTPVAVDAAAWNHLVGAVVIACAYVALTSTQTWQEWVAVLAGLWLVVAPWVLGYESAGFMWSSVVTGVLVVSLAVAALQGSLQGPRTTLRP